AAGRRHGPGRHRAAAAGRVRRPHRTRALPDPARPGGDGRAAVRTPGPGLAVAADRDRAAVAAARSIAGFGARTAAALRRRRSADGHVLAHRLARALPPGWRRRRTPAAHVRPLRNPPAPAGRGAGRARDRSGVRGSGCRGGRTPAVAGQRGKRIGWGEQSEPQHRSLPQIRQPALATSRTLGFALLTPTYADATRSRW